MTNRAPTFLFCLFLAFPWPISVARAAPDWATLKRLASFWEDHPLEILLVGLGFLILGGLSAYLWHLSRRFNQTRLALAQLNASLESQVAERTAALAETNHRLAEEQERFRGLAASTFEGVAIHDGEIILEVNQGLLNLFGYTYPEMIGLRLEAAIAPDSLPILLEHVHLRSSEPYEVDCLRKDGSRFPVEIHARDAHFQGRPVRVAAVRDLTERKKIEARLRQLSRAVEQSANPILITNADGSIEFVNPAFEQVTGYSREEVVGQNPRLLRSGLTPPEIYRELWETIVRGEVWQGELLNRKKNGDLYWESAVISPVRDENGRVANFVAIQEDITARKETEARLSQYTKNLEELQGQLREQAIRDPLTGVFNRRYLMETLVREISRAERENYPISLVIMDLDHFKNINDTYGHLAGDAVLKGLASLFEKETRKGDVVCRYGGEEFVVLMPGIPVDKAAQRAEAWRALLEQNPIAHAGRPIPVTVSMGVAVAEASTGLNSDQLLSQADQALYIAKASGRNRVVTWQKPD